MMLYFAILPSGPLVYTDKELFTSDAPKMATFLTRLQQLQDFLDARPRFKPSTLSGGAAIAWNAVKAALQNAGQQALLAQTMWKGYSLPGVPIVQSLAAATYACIWDGVALNVTTVVGTFPAGGIPVSGWPQTDVLPDVADPPSQDALNAAQVAAAAKQAAQDTWRAQAQAAMRAAADVAAFRMWLQANPMP